MRKACVGWLWRERKPNLFEPVKCCEHLAGLRWRSGAQHRVERAARLPMNGLAPCKKPEPLEKAARARGRVGWV